MGILLLFCPVRHLPYSILEYLPFGTQSHRQAVPQYISHSCYVYKTLNSTPTASLSTKSIAVNRVPSSLQCAFHMIGNPSTVKPFSPSPFFPSSTLPTRECFNFVVPHAPLHIILITPFHSHCFPKDLYTPLSTPTAPSWEPRFSRSFWGSPEKRFEV